MLRKFNIIKEISMSQNHSKTNDAWSEWQDNNSPIHNEAICPLFYTETKNDNAKSIDRNGNYYEVTAEGSLRKNGEFIAHVNNKRFERTELEYKGDLCEWYNGHLYTGVRNNDIIKIYEDGNLVETVYAEEDPLCERLYHGKYFGAYYSSTVNRRITFYGWSKTVSTLLSAYVEFNSPAIFVHGDIACLSPSTGLALKRNNLDSEFYYNDTQNDSILPLINPITSGTISVPQQTVDLSVFSSCTVTSSYTTEIKTCYLGNDNYYYDEVSGARLTFENGYKPTYTGNSNYYRYTVITTVFTYTGTVNNTANLSSKMTVIVPNETSWAWDFDGNTTINTRTLSFTTNFGPKTLEIPRAQMLCESTEWNIPSRYIQTRATYEYRVTYVTTATTSSANAFGDAWVMLDDGNFYNIIGDTNTSNWGTFIGYTINWTWDGNIVRSASYGRPSVVADKGCFFGGTWPHHVRFRYDIGYGNYFRIAADMHSGEDDGTVFQPKDKTWNWGYDAYIGIPFMDCGLTLDGTDSTKFWIPYGSKPNVVNKFTPLFNDGFINGISYNGIMVTPLQSVDTAVPFSKDDNNLVYRDVDTNKWIKLRQQL